MPTKNGAGKPMAFFADIDGTLHGTSDTAQRALLDWTAYWHEVERPIGSILCYNTGRCIAEYTNILEPELPSPDVLISGDGTEIRWKRPVSRTSTRDSTKSVERPPSPCYDLDRDWAQAVESCWDRARNRVVAALDADDEGHIGDLNALSNSPPRGENRWAISVLGEARAHELAARYAAQFAADGITCYAMGGWGDPRCHLVVAVPAVAGKLNAARHVQQRLGVADDACVAAGDSENDTPMLRGGYGFIMVSNAVDKLASALDDAGTPELHYRASETHARGVVEGLEYFRRRMNGRGSGRGGTPSPAASATANSREL